MDLEDHYCGFCGSQLLRKEGKWTQYGDEFEFEVYWVFLCKPCRKHLWRLYSKLDWDENLYDYHQFNKDFKLFLKYEMARHKAN